MKGHQVKMKNFVDLFQNPKSLFLNGEPGVALYIPITPEQAELCVTHLLWNRQRPLNSSKIQLYADQMTRGEWVPGRAIEFTMKPDGKIDMVNGHHRLRAVIKSGKSQIFTVTVQRVKDDHDIGVVYASIDRQKIRTAYDVAHAIGIDTEFGWSKVQVNILMPAVRFIASDFTSDSNAENLTPGIQELLLRKYANPYNDWLKLTTGTSNKMRSRLARRSTLAVALITLSQSIYQYGTDKVNSFWHSIAFVEGFHERDPRKAAYEYLDTTAMPSGNKASGEKIVTPMHSARYLANCFNAWVENGSLKNARVNDEKSPIKILGSSYNGQSVHVEPLLWG